MNKAAHHPVKKSKHLLRRTTMLAAMMACCACTNHMSSSSRLGPQAGKPVEPPKDIKRDADTPQPLAKGKKTYVLLQVDGGGIMGITPATVLARLEGEMRQRRPDFRGKTLKDVLSVCSGTSTGAIITGMVAAGVPAEEIARYYTVEGVDLFQRKARYPFPVFPFFTPRYDRATFQNTLFEVIDRYHPRRPEDGSMMLSELDKQRGGAPLLIIPAYDLRSKRTHFLRSRGFKDSPLDSEYDMQLVDAISCSALNAAMYFGKVQAPDQKWEYVQADGTRQMMKGAVYNDGGQGTQNNTLGLTLLEALSRGWGTKDGEQVVIISLGCGDDFKPKSYANAARLSGAAQVWKFAFKGQARDEAALLQWRAGRQLAAYNANYKVFRFNFVPKSATAFSVNSKQLTELQHEQPEKIFERLDFRQLVKDLCDPAVDLAGPKKEKAGASVPAPSLPMKMAPRGL